MNANAQTGDTQDAARLRALLSQLNWLNALNDEPANGVYEYQFHSDAHITGEFTSGLGPYSFLNTVPIPDTPGIVTAPIILRLVDHLPEYRPDMSKKDETFYHGGTMVDELAALSSLCIGARIMAGGESRRFEPGKDPMGRPCAWDYKPAPFLRVRPGRYVLPSITGTHSLDNLNMLKSIPKISPERYVNLIRSCIAYQDALWAAESEPHLAWLLFVSALETAANDIYLSDTSPAERLKDAKPDVATILDEAGGHQLVEKIAELIAPSLGATKKFLDFTLNFGPNEPTDRPDQEWLRVKWSKTNLKHTLSKVYNYRSRSLHGGLPFPAPMYDPPFYFDRKSKPSEVPLTGRASHSRGGTWLPDDMPVNLHCFHYITRETLINWWRNLANER
ncbi:hypothetical protein [Candidatus Kuenenia sp.]|uniref:hypothetical protein n=1 Tax=Candidatus Kuenenia sp. TaxID=2499824 RepID=UPI00321FC51B